ncbi:hypothetical protein [Rugosimonospora africana]|uniref:Uncharacterized protein n=1 Tax=Rugosimonospora africana TaxID=556532 RepID=A0A8J3QU03_9ACTN|nr:hypothetical protein [Rugosimonospora africana]GIH15967.1 hypothetical protein Raf01_41390 [Rugosimonospora africana]
MNAPTAYTAIPGGPWPPIWPPRSTSLLRPTARAIREATERWADEDAARDNDRRLVAETIAQVALLGRDSPAPGAVARATGGQVPKPVIFS